MKAAGVLFVILLIGVASASPASPREEESYTKAQWGLRMIDGPDAWDISTGRSARVAVIDTGLDEGHPDLRQNVLAGGVDFLDGDRRPTDTDGHGTHVAGIIAAADDGVGVTGVAPNARLLPVRVCDIHDCPVSAIARGVRYAADRGADVINLSLGANAVTAQAKGDAERIRRAVAYAADTGAVIVAAAGNGFLPICDEPAAAVICVGSVGPNKQKTFYSNSDATLRVNFLVAPGGDDLPDCQSWVLSTWPRKLETFCAGKGYDASTGTSMAAPHVSGVAALLISKGLEGGAVVRRILRTTEDLGAPGRDPVYGFGLVDAAEAVRS